MDNKLNKKIANLSILGQKEDDYFSHAPVNEKELILPPTMANHPAFSKVFIPGKLTLGLISPFKGYPDSPFPDISDLGEVAQQAEQAGFAALWIRDVPFYDPNFGDVGQELDPFVTLGYLAAKTNRIALGTTGILAPLRDPIHIAKAAVSLAKLTSNRFILGLSTGDRPVEYPAFNVDFAKRADLYREAWELIKHLTSHSYPELKTESYGTFRGKIDLVPKLSQALPMIAVGRARQEFSWLANTPDAWIWHGFKPEQTTNINNTIAHLNQDGYWRPLGAGYFIELLEDVEAPLESFNNLYLKGGAKALGDYFVQQQANGLAHATINLKPTKRPYQEIFEEFQKYILSRLA
ncbi:LLM class flavin-dependent oxidoreductase [Psittacicella hinzii]|uniref:LLM class flavin-dependent oxidoreductase n=1 Tax=Psittacicella hinzii TaxID=2028575 RepID=A0A3A1Y0R6_9GAMM|nr:TIGR03571 family LLM class oxidoreductase [Psittacicella hinzii]RIY31040.1 LLM class flavin-dependent oxidoreductase [Psittacicella hinzii]